MSDFDNYWPSLKKAQNGDDIRFWKYQWNKHGTCSSMDPKDYFKLVFQIYKKHNLKTILKQKGNINPGGQKILSKDIFNAIKAGTNYEPQIVCRADQNHSSYLLQVRVCLDKSGVYKDCVATPGDPLIKCPKSVYIP